MPLAALTALQGLRDHGRLTAGQRVLIIGASGGVGTFAVQIARSFDAEVTGVCSARNVDLVRSLGADHVVDYTSEDVTRSAETYDLVLQAAGAHTASALRRVLTSRGVLVMISGDSEGRWVGPVGRMVGARLTSPFVGQTLTSFTVTPNADDLEEVGRLVEAGAVTPVIDRTYTFGDVAGRPALPRDGARPRQGGRRSRPVRASGPGAAIRRRPPAAAGRPPPSAR